MAQPPRRPARSSTGARRRLRRQEPTERVRVRAKAPLIERKDDFFAPDEGETVLHEDPTPAAIAAPRPVLFDEDATELAPPPRRKKPLRAQSPERRRGSDTPKIKPGRPMEIPGTEAAAAMAARARVERLAELMPVARLPALKSVAGLLLPGTLVRLESALLGEHERGRSASSTGSPKRLAEALLHGEAYASLELEDRVVLLEGIAKSADRPDTWRHAAQLLESVPKGGQARARRRSLELFRALEARHRPALVELAARSLHRRSVLEDQDLEGGALVEHLFTLATADKLAEPIERRGLRPRDVLTLLLGVLARPARIALEEGADGVLGALEFALAETSPAEYARLWRHLVLGGMTVGLAGDRHLDLKRHLARHDVAFDGTNTPFRVALELLAGLVRPKRGPSRGAFLMPGGQGVDADVTAHALSLLYGMPYAVSAGAAAVKRALATVGREADRVPPVFMSVLYEGGERLFVYDGLDKDEIFVRAPHGSSSKPTGAERKRPARTVRDPERGLESLPLAYLAREVGVIIAPTS